MHVCVIHQGGREEGGREREGERKGGRGRERERKGGREGGILQ